MAEAGKAPGRVYLEAVLEGKAPPPPYAKLLDMRLTEVGDGTTAFELPVTQALYNPSGIVHGGAITSLVDSAMGLAVVTTLGEGENFTTAELKVNFLRPITTDSGPLRSIGRVLHRGRQLVVTEGDVFDAGNQLVARASGTNLILPVRGQPAVLPPAPDIAAVAQPPAPPPPPPAPAPTAATSAGLKHRVRLFGGEMAYQRAGQGPAVILLHGIPSSSYLWRDVIGPLSAAFDVIAPDLLGYGDSDKRLDADLSLAAQARYVVALMESLQVRQGAVVGHDIGGGIAQLIAADEPGRVARLVLIDSVVDDAWPIPDIARLKEPAWDQIMVDLDLRRGFKKGLDAGIVTPGRVTDEMLEEFVRPFGDQPGRRAYLRAARALNNRDLVSRSHHIAEIQTPTLILWGANDGFLAPRWGEHLQRKLPHASLQLIDPGGHFLPLDRPDAVTEALKQFLSAP